MDNTAAETLLTSLLERLEADARSKPSRFEGLVSASERAALKIMVENWSRKRNNSASAPEETPAASNQTTPSETVPAAQEDKVRVDETVLGFDASPEPEWVLCLDFGTAKSKAFAATNSEEPRLLDLPLGKMDGDPDNSVYAVSSSIGIDNEGLVFAGAEAVRRGMDWMHSGTQRRRRLDSLKQEISQVLFAGGPKSDLWNKTLTHVRKTYLRRCDYILSGLLDGLGYDRA